MVRKILEEKIVSVPEVKEILSNLEKQIGREQFDSFQEATIEYAETFAKVNAKKGLKIKKMLMKDYNMSEQQAIIVVNIIPNSIEELRTIFEKDVKMSKLKNDELQEMIYKIQDLAK